MCVGVQATINNPIDDSCGDLERLHGAVNHVITVVR